MCLSTIGHCDRYLCLMVRHRPKKEALRGVLPRLWACLMVYRRVFSSCSDSHRGLSCIVSLRAELYVWYLFNGTSTIYVVSTTAVLADPVDVPQNHHQSR
jgi:hypothetical protein